VVAFWRGDSGVLKKSEQQPARETILQVASGVAVTGVTMLLSALIAWTLFPRGSMAITVFVAISVLTTTFITGIIGAPAISRASSRPWPKALRSHDTEDQPLLCEGDCGCGADGTPSAVRWNLKARHAFLNQVPATKLATPPMPTPDSVHACTPMTMTASTPPAVPMIMQVGTTRIATYKHTDLGD
jgi:hypothetical protein